MRCLMVFDNLNDIVFMKCDTKFCVHIRKIGISQDLIQQTEVTFFSTCTKLVTYT